MCTPPVNRRPLCRLLSIGPSVACAPACVVCFRWARRAWWQRLPRQRHAVARSTVTPMSSAGCSTGSGRVIDYPTSLPPHHFILHRYCAYCTRAIKKPPSSFNSPHATAPSLIPDTLPAHKVSPVFRNFFFNCALCVYFCGVLFGFVLALYYCMMLCATCMAKKIAHLNSPLK